MNIAQATRQIRSEFIQKGCDVRIISIKHLAELDKEINAKYRRELDDTFFQERLTHFIFNIPEDLPHVESIIITSAPQNQKLVIFNKDKISYSVTIPPTYSFDTDTEVENMLMSSLDQEGYHLYPCRLPLKILATRSGLLKYGRNNVTYSDSSGSFHRLKAFLSDIPVVEDIWNEPILLESCQSCAACIKNCPTGAIRPDQFQIQPERCLTFHNERSIAFPGWIKPRWHHCLIGCMKCQLCCPANKELTQIFEQTEQFTFEETDIILKGTPYNKLPRAVIKKLEKIYLLDDLALLPRNLSVLLS